MVLETASRIGDTTRPCLDFQDDSLLASGKEAARGLMIVCLQESDGEFMTILAALADLGHGESGRYAGQGRKAPNDGSTKDHCETLPDLSWRRSLATGAPSVAAAGQAERGRIGFE
ncbi:hypothetical protein CU048_00640 [Beijerinckiaceae bacterium]|nr:hypothetical protein CU048_00640 [Beijerinckiaceae bacterium]